MTWTRLTSSASFSGRYQHGCAVVGTQIVLVGGRSSTGFLNDVWASNDTGSSWAQKASENLAMRACFGLATFLGQLWVIGGFGSGFYNDVWYTNGTTVSNWTLANGSVFPYPRYGMGVTVFNNRMWVSAGYSFEFGYLNDVWR